MTTRGPAWVTRRAARCALTVALALLLLACAPFGSSAPGSDHARNTVAAVTTDADTKARAHAALAHQLRGFLIERGPAPRSPAANDDERFRLGAFWRARSDTHRFGEDFHTRAAGVLALPAPSPADPALRALLDVVDARLPAWQALVDYNASGRMRDDGGDGGRPLLPGAIAALDAIEAAVWRYLDAVDAAADTQAALPR